VDARDHRPQPVIGIVDPRPEDYWQFAEQAEAAGAACRYAATGEQAPRLAEWMQPALWLVSSELADMTGLELCRLLQRRRGRAPLFVVAHAYQPQAEVAVLAAGGNFLCKPIPAAVLESLPATAASSGSMPLVGAPQAEQALASH